MLDAKASRDPFVWGLVAAIAVLTVAIDALTPLGYAVWCGYFVAVAATLFQTRLWLPLVTAAACSVLVSVGGWLSPPGGAFNFVVVNRTIGVVSFWAMAIVVTQALRGRRDMARLSWLQDSENQLFGALRGEQTPDEIATNAVRTLGDRLHAQVGALYRLEGERLLLTGGMALASDAPASLPLANGQLGEAVLKGEACVIGPLADSHLRLVSGLGQSAPQQLLLAPVTADGNIVGAIELGRCSNGDPKLAKDVLTQAGEVVGVAMRTALLRSQLVALLEETQRQSEELQAQQEELRVANEELEEQSRGLQQSQASLENQQSELEQVNVQLEERTHELESQKQALISAQGELLRNTQELAAASRYKSEFLANMSHELRTPLNSALILAKLLADNKSDTLTAEQVKYAQAIHASNTDLLVLINDILDLSRIEAGHVELTNERVPLSAVLQRLRDTFEPLAQQKHLALEVDAAADAPDAIVVDSQRLQQILKNLLANAIKFTDTGKVSLSVQRAGDGRVRFMVCDTGIGIGRDQTRVIFEAFRQADGSTRRRYGGTGLGLSISRDLAARMGGTISVDSEPGRGSCFSLELPVEGADEAATTPPATIAPGALGASAGTPAAPQMEKVMAAIAATAPARAAADSAAAATPRTEDDREQRSRAGRLILAVEDDAAFASALVTLAHEMDFDCIVASTAEEALQLAAEHHPSGILLDIGLPDVSGLTVLERLKRDPATRHIPVHVVSALERSQVALEMGAVGYLIKPADREMLAGAIRELEQRNARELRRLLIVEDDRQLRANLELLLAGDQLEITAVGTVAAALEQLTTTTFDCMVTDLALPDGSGYDLLEKMAASDDVGFPPVIVYTGRALSRDEEQRLRRYSKSIIIKGARSPERLLDEVTLFLHSVEASLPSNQQRLLREARRRDAVLDGRTVLLAEDDVRNIFALSSVLEPLGVSLEIARNGREALERLAKTEVDLVLMDIMMPEMDGLTAMREIRAQPALRDLPIVALTAKAMADDRERCLEAGANDYIAKPIDVDKLVSLCRVWCSRR